MLREANLYGQASDRAGAGCSLLVEAAQDPVTKPLFLNTGYVSRVSRIPH